MSDAVRSNPEALHPSGTKEERQQVQQLAEPGRSAPHTEKGAKADHNNKEKTQVAPALNKGMPAQVRSESTNGGPI